MTRFLPLLPSLSSLAARPAPHTKKTKFFFWGGGANAPLNHTRAPGQPPLGGTLNSSAPIERVFSMLKTVVLGDQQGDDDILHFQRACKMMPLEKLKWLPPCSKICSKTYHNL